MPRAYAKVSSEMWGDARFCALSPIKPTGQDLWIYLLTGRFRTSIPGLNLNIGIGALSDRLKWRIVEVERCWDEIAQQGMAEADWPSGVVWLPNGIVHNAPESPNVITGWSKVVLPECPLTFKALGHLDGYLARHHSKAYAEAFRKAFEKFVRHFPKGFREGFGDTFRERSPNQEQEQEQDPSPQPPAHAGGRITRDERRRAEVRIDQAFIQRQREGFEGRPIACPHDPPHCPTRAECIEREALETRTRRAG